MKPSKSCHRKLGLAKCREPLHWVSGAAGSVSKCLSSLVQFPLYNEHPSLTILVGNLIIKTHYILQGIFTNVIASTSAEKQQREGEVHLPHLTGLSIWRLVWARSLSSLFWQRHKAPQAGISACLRVQEWRDSHSPAVPAPPCWLQGKHRLCRLPRATEQSNLDFTKILLEQAPESSIHPMTGLAG